MLTVVITSFNRGDLVARAVRSALEFVQAFSDAEVVIVDDASTDETPQLLSQAFAHEIETKLVVYWRNPRNLGVTESKNIGYCIARQRWVGFLDSDDLLLLEQAEACRAILERHPDTPIVFFRCVDNAGRVVGTLFPSDRLLDLRTYLQYTSYGEAFTVVNKSRVAREPYVAELMGYEGLGCARIIATYGPAILAAAPVRQYRQSGRDRLSAGSGMLRRANLIGRGHRMMLREFWDQIPGSVRLSLAAKSLVYSLVGAVHSGFTRHSMAVLM